MYQNRCAMALQETDFPVLFWGRFIADELNWSAVRKLQPINFMTLTRVTNNASCNWVIGQFHWRLKQFESEGPIFWRRDFFWLCPHTLYTMSPHVSTEVAQIIRRTLNAIILCKLYSDISCVTWVNNKPSLHRYCKCFLSLSRREIWSRLRPGG